MSALTPELERLARGHGIETSYVDGQGEAHGAEPEACLALLRALGAPVSSERDAPSALLELRRAHWRTVLPPVLVTWDAGPIRVGLRLPAELAEADLEATIRPREPLGPAPDDLLRFTLRLAGLPVAQDARVDGQGYVRKLVELPGPCLGTHELELRIGELHARSLVLCAPERIDPPPGEAGARERDWGVFLPLHALRTRGDWGIGDYGALAELVRWTAERGGSFVGVLPMNAPQPGELVSPYRPSSRLLWNELLLDVEGLPELTASEPARAALEEPGFRAERERLRSRRLVDHEAVARLQRRVLEQLHRARAFDAGALADFLRRRPEVEDYARFRAVQEQRGAAWQEWPAPLCDGVIGPADHDPELAGYHAFVQWLAERQVEALARVNEETGTRLYLDLPLGVHPSGYDAWRERDAFLAGVSVGAPPDAFFDAGQDWGFAPPHPQRVREQGHRYFAACLRHHLGRAKLLRVDHVMGLHHLYLIPPGASAREGLYVGYRPDELYAVLSLEAARAGASVVGEDLGTVPAYVRTTMARHGLQRMYVLPFELETDGEPRLPEPPADALASLGTHDTPTFLGTWTGRVPGAERGAEERGSWQAALVRALVARGFLAAGDAPRDPAEVLRAALAFLAESPACGVLVSLEDLWLEPDPQNVPGTSEEQHPNWRRRSLHALEELAGLAPVEELLAELRRRRPRHGKAARDLHPRAPCPPSLPASDPRA